LALKIIPELINSEPRLGISGSLIALNQIFEKKNAIETPKKIKILKNKILMSIKNNDGERLLIDTIIKKCGLKQLENINILLNERHLTNLSACLSNLNDTDAIVKNRLPFDLLSIELRDGIQNLSKITGQELTEELLDNIFSKFCIGK